jgi:hypothetical protein
LVVGHRPAAEVLACQFGDAIVGDSPEAVRQPIEIKASKRRQQHQCRRMTGVADAVQHCDATAHGVAGDDRPGDADRVAESPYVISARLEAPVGRPAPFRSTVVAEIEVYHLRVTGQAAEMRLEVRVVIAARAAVQQHDGRQLAHRAAIGDNRWTLNVEPQPCSIYVDVHDPSKATPQLDGYTKYVPLRSTITSTGLLPPL